MTPREPSPWRKVVATLRRLAGGPSETAEEQGGVSNAEDEALAPEDGPRPKIPPPKDGPHGELQASEEDSLLQGVTALVHRAEVGPPDETLVADARRLLAEARSSPFEGRALDVFASRLVPALKNEPLRVAVASAYADRGNGEAAEGLLASSTSAAGLRLQAELAEARGDGPRALALVERVLLRDVDHPGARERHQALLRALGRAHPGGGEGRGDPRGDVTEVKVASGAALSGAPFLLHREVARGGAGVVFEGEDRDLQRRVAVKVYHHAARDRAQLLHEAQVTASLRSPFVLRVFDVDPDQGWIALQWASGGSLRDILRREDRHPELVPFEGWVPALARALAHVHRAGWVHNDLKPANVLLRTEDRHLVLADFGTARRPGEPSPPGSLGYVSPERLAGRATHPDDDVYGFGRILEDALRALTAPAPVGSDDTYRRWRALAASCLGNAEGRPRDGSALLDLVG